MSVFDPAIIRRLAGQGDGYCSLGIAKVRIDAPPPPVCIESDAVEKRIEICIAPQIAHRRLEQGGGLAILIGSEVNSEIEHAAAEAGSPDAKARGEKAPSGNSGNRQQAA